MNADASKTFYFVDIKVAGSGIEPDLPGLWALQDTLPPAGDSCQLPQSGCQKHETNKGLAAKTFINRNATEKGLSPLVGVLL